MSDTGQKHTILVVDDETMLRTGVQRILEMEGYEVDTAENGTQGIEKGSTKEFDVAIIDLKMPDKSGIDVLREIRDKKPNTICFIATGFGSYETAIQATRLGAFGYILKPFTDDELMRNVSNGMERRRLILEAEKLRKDRENRLLEIAFERTRLNTIINSLADGVLVINKNSEVVYYNPAALTFLQLDSIKIEEVITDKLPDKVTELINSFLTSKDSEIKASSIQVEIKPNRELFVEVTCSPVPDADGDLTGVVIVIKNITDFKRIEHLKSQFVSMVSHELKAPMAATIGFMNILNNKDVNLSKEQQEDFIDRSINRLQGLLNMVNDLLDISRMEMKTVVRELKEIDLNEVINEVINMFGVEINEKQLEVVFSPNNELPKLMADFMEIQRLFTNLVSNAIKYNKKQGKIIITLEVSGSYIKATVKDTGIGLREEDKKKMFTEFFRAKNEFTKGVHGTGLGMSIVKRIIDSYSGKIEFDSEFGRGTTFTVCLPYKADHPAEETDEA